MAPPKPAPGQVIRYSYLWSEEHRRGQEEGTKDRPCVIVLAVDRDDDGLDLVTVLPVTHSPRADPSLALEIPRGTKLRLGLDDERSWIVLTEANQFFWPGPDLRPIPNSKPRTAIYGLLPQNFFELMRGKFVAALRARRISVVRRSD